MTRCETWQFAPVRLGKAMSHEEFSRYEWQVKGLLGNNKSVLELQNSISDAAVEIAEQADKLGHAAADESSGFRQVEICAIRSVECWMVMVVGCG